MLFLSKSKINGRVCHEKKLEIICLSVFCYAVAHFVLLDVYGGCTYASASV